MEVNVLYVWYHSECIPAIWTGTSHQTLTVSVIPNYSCPQQVASENTLNCKHIQLYLQFLPRPLSLYFPGLSSLVPKIEEWHLDKKQKWHGCFQITSQQKWTGMLLSNHVLRGKLVRCFGLERFRQSQEKTLINTSINGLKVYKVHITVFITGTTLSKLSLIVLLCAYVQTCFCVWGPLWLRNIFSTEQPKPHTSAAVRVPASSSSGVRVATRTY